MINEYWKQWDTNDLDSWQGKDCTCDEEVSDEIDLDVEDAECEEYDEPLSLESLGMSWRDFM